MTTLAIITALIMTAVSLLHFYWALGGNYGLSSAGPTLEGKDNFIPPRPMIFAVACVLLSLAILSIQLIWPVAYVTGFISYIAYFVAFIFIIRGIGDFKYVGIFKKVYNSNFAKLDTVYFSPLILLLGIAYALLAKYGI